MCKKVILSLFCPAKTHLVPLFFIHECIKMNQTFKNTAFLLDGIRISIHFYFLHTDMKKNPFKLN
jgi:hypothetical protein